MPKVINEKEVKERIKANTLIMRESKKALFDMVNEAMKNATMNDTFAKDSRAHLTNFVNAVRAIEKDKAKLTPKGE